MYLVIIRFKFCKNFTRIAIDAPPPLRRAREISVARERKKKRIDVHRASGVREFPAAAPRRVRAQNPVWLGRRRLRTVSPSELWAEFRRRDVDARRPGVYAPDDPRRAFVGALLSSLAHALAWRRDASRLGGSVTRRAAPDFGFSHERRSSPAALSRAIISGGSPIFLAPSAAFTSPLPPCADYELYCIFVKWINLTAGQPPTMLF